MTEPRIASLLDGVAALHTHLADTSRQVARLADLLQDVHLALRDEHDHETANRVWKARERALEIMRQLQRGASAVSQLLGGAVEDADQTERFVREMLTDDEVTKPD